MNSPGVGFFSDIVGADVFAHTKRGDIRGILVNDAARTIEFDLKRPRADFPNILALPFATAVPAGTPAADRSTHPIPSTGPYTLAHYTPQVRFTLVRNPYFVPTRSIPRGNPDRVTVEIVGDDSRALQEVIRNAADDDLESIPTDRLKEVQSRFADRLRFSTLPTTIYFALNTRTPPFTDVRVRRAVNYAIDRRAIVTLLGGLATPTENLLPPTYPAYRQLWLYPYDRARARQLIASAHADGNEVGVWGPSAPSVSEQIVLYAADSLRKIGLRPRIHLLGGAVYWAVIGNQRTRAQMVSAGWAADYPQPLDWFDHQLNGANITANHNTNYANANDPQINRLIEKLKRKPRLTPAINNAWAKVDRLVQERAFLVPLANPLGTHFFSRRIDERCFVDHVVYGFDWSQICVR